jgi:hypothetical protein
MRINASGSSITPESDPKSNSRAGSESDSRPDSESLTEFSPEILTWKTITTADWTPDTRQPVFTGGNTEK